MADQETTDRFVNFCHGHLNGVKEMLADDPDLVNSRSSLGESPLGAAAHVGDRAMAEYLLSQGAELDFPAAVMLGDLAWVRPKLDGDPALSSSAGAHGIPVFFHAVAGGNVEMVELLLDNGADPSSITGPKAGSLNMTAARGHEAMTAWLLERGARPDVVDWEGKTALQRAEENGNETIALMLRGA